MRFCPQRLEGFVGQSKLAALLAATVIGGIVLLTSGDGGSTVSPRSMRADCATDWTGYTDPGGHFSFCYPAELRLTIGRQEPYAVSAERRLSPGGGPEANVIAFSIWRTRTSQFETDRCNSEAQHFEVPVREEEMTVAGQSIIVCRAVGDTPTHGVAPLTMYIPYLPTEGWVRIEILFGRDPERAARLIDGILASLKIPAD
jgi:hypothetical protein